MLEEEVAARKQLPAEPPHARGPAGGENAALGEAPAPLTRDRVSQAPATAARLLQYASKASTHMPIVQYVHVHAEHNARQSR